MFSSLQSRFLFPFPLPFDPTVGTANSTSRSTSLCAVAVTRSEETNERDKQTTHTSTSTCILFYCMVCCSNFLLDQPRCVLSLSPARHTKSSPIEIPIHNRSRSFESQLRVSILLQWFRVEVYTPPRSSYRSSVSSSPILSPSVRPSSCRLIPPNCPRQAPRPQLQLQRSCNNFVRCATSRTKKVVVC